MKYLLNVLMIVSLVFSQSSTTKIGDFYYNSDGSSTTNIGDFYYNSNIKKTKIYILDDNNSNTENTKNWWDPE